MSEKGGKGRAGDLADRNQIYRLEFAIGGLNQLSFLGNVLCFSFSSTLICQTYFFFILAVPTSKIKELQYGWILSLTNLTTHTRYNSNTDLCTKQIISGLHLWQACSAE